MHERVSIFFKMQDPRLWGHVCSLSEKNILSGKKLSVLTSDTLPFFNSGDRTVVLRPIKKSEQEIVDPTGYQRPAVRDSSGALDESVVREVNDRMEGELLHLQVRKGDQRVVDARTVDVSEYIDCAQTHPPEWMALVDHPDQIAMSQVNVFRAPNAGIYQVKSVSVCNPTDYIMPRSGVQSDTARACAEKLLGSKEVWRVEIEVVSTGYIPLNLCDAFIPCLWLKDGNTSRTREFVRDFLNNYEVLY